MTWASRRKRGEQGMVRSSHLQESAAEPRKIIPETAAPSKKIGERSIAEPSLGGPLVATLVVLALLAISVVLLRRLMKKSKLLAGAGALKILGRRAITSKQEIVLVEVGSRILLLGSTRESLSTLADFARADEVALLRARCSGN